MKAPSILILCTLLSGCSSLSFGPKANRDAFFEEIIFPEESSLTHKFDAYTRHSYMIDKMDLASALLVKAEEKEKRILGLYLIGPGYFDPLWTYYIMAFFEEENEIRMNILVYPHARITGKGTGTIPRKKYTEFQEQFMNLDYLTKGWPESENEESAEFAFNILGVTYTEEKIKVVHGEIGDLSEEQSKNFEETFNGMFTRHESTYPNLTDKDVQQDASRNPDKPGS